MLERSDFEEKLIVFFFPAFGDKISYQNDNLVIKDKEGKIKAKVTCYRLFLLFVVGDTSITTGLLSRASKFKFSICFMNRNLKTYKFVGSRMEGNTLLRRAQYEYSDYGIARHVIRNKINNQIQALKNIRQKNDAVKEAISKLKGYVADIDISKAERKSLLGIEGSAARLYFPLIFSNTCWRGRKPRIKSDYVNASLDIGYTILFNLMDALINIYGFDEYCGVFHTMFYMRKSLVCDLVEPFRVIIDHTTRRAINLKQILPEDFENFNGRYVLKWDKSQEYTKIYLSELLKYKREVFIYVRDYYRAFMKRKEIKDFPIFKFPQI